MVLDQMLAILLLFVFGDRESVYFWLTWNSFVDQVDLELRDLPASASPNAGIKSVITGLGI